MTVTKKYNEMCNKYKNKLQPFGVQCEQEHDDLVEIVPTDKHEYFENQ